jgi:hypothetical protein
VAGAAVEIACDESGFSGTNLLHPATPVITHASARVRSRHDVSLASVAWSGSAAVSLDYSADPLDTGSGSDGSGNLGYLID